MKKIRLPGNLLPLPDKLLKVLLFMKVCFTIILVTCLQVSAKVYAQKTKLTFKAEKVQLARILKLIEKKTDYRFVYSNDVLPAGKRITFTAEEAPFDEVMKTLLDDTGLNFKMLSNNLVAIAPAHTIIADIVVKGRVADAAGQPLPGVAVMIEGTNRGTVTNAQGQYELRAPGTAKLVFSFLGYLTQTLAVDDKTQLNVTLREDTKGLNEVIVVGYGQQKKANLTGAVASISTSQIRQRPVTSIQNALQGLTPGLTVLNRPGDVGSDVGTMTIRGRTNLSAPGPLIVIDGIPASNRELASLNPSDIESMSVLKDASSAAIYGARAANGVLLITTKRGKEGKASIDLNAMYGIQSPTRLPDYLGSGDFARLYNEAMANAGKQPRYTAEEIAKFDSGADPDLYPNTDWYDQALVKNPSMKELQVGVNGSNEKTMYYISGAWFGQQSLVPNKGMNRYTIRSNVSAQVLPILNVGANMAFLKQDVDTDGGELNWVSLNRLGPTMAARQSDGSWGTINGGKADATLAKDNVLRNMTDGGRSWFRNQVAQTALNATLTPLPGLSIKGLGSLKYTNDVNNRFINELPPLINFLTKQPIASTAVTPNEMTENWVRRQEMLLQAYAEYEKSFGKHGAKIMIGASQESNELRNAYLGRRRFPNNAAETVGMGAGGSENMTADANKSTAEEWAIRSYFGRANYNYQDKYLFEANLRLDLSSRFHPDYRLAKFPSVSAGWRISEEPFLKPVHWINNLKLRGSWGILGNQDNVTIGNYYDRLKTGYAYNFEGAPVDGVWQSDGTNKLASWEEVTMTDIGLDFTLFNGAIDVTADYYVKKTDGILLAQSVPLTYALTAATVNAGSTKNTGFELMISHSGRINKDLEYRVAGNLSHIRNKIVYLGEGVTERLADRWIERVGESVGSFYGWEAMGLFKDQKDVDDHAKQSASTKPGDIKYKDQDGNGVIDAGDRVILGNDVPWVNYGGTLGISWKGIDLEAIIYGAAGLKTYLDGEAAYSFFNGASVKDYHLKRWTKENPDPNAAYPRLLISADGKHNYDNRSSFWLFNASYLRIRSLSLGYSFPERLVKKAGMQQAKFFITSNNPFTFMFDDRLTDYDPETASGRGGYLGIKTWSMGMNVRF
ncbi:SusC/RagA family TonB-linked outer membrane protein [Chitinophaga lutea]